MTALLIAALAVILLAAIAGWLTAIELARWNNRLAEIVRELKDTIEEQNA